MPHILRVLPHVEGIVYQVTDVANRIITVTFAGRRVWSFPEQPGDVPPQFARSFGEDAVVRFQPWPAAIHDHMVGTTEIGLVTEADGPETSPETAVTALFASPDGAQGPVEITDIYGRHLVLNKWGRLGRALADAPPGMVERMLDSMDRVRELVQGELGDRVYVTGGTLLGPVREGRLLPHDDDADLAYLSAHDHPLDVTLEAFELGRVLASAGFEVLRLSAGHLQVVVDHDDVPDHYVDVFTGFLLDGVWHQHFPIRTRAVESDLLPPVAVDVVGRSEPAPRDPERMLVELFGADWKVPDPSYTFDVPRPTSDRFYGWFADYNAEREDWDQEFLSVRSAAVRPPGLSAFGAWVDDRLPEGGSVLDLGCGAGADAWVWSGRGRTVEAVDYSRYAVAVARRARATDRAPSFRVLNLLDVRSVVRFGAELAHRVDHWTVVGRRLLNALEDRGRDNVWRLCSMLLRPHGAVHVDLVRGAGHPGVPEYRRLDLAQVVQEAGGHRLELVEAVEVVEPVGWFGSADEPLTPLWRATFRRRT